MYIHKLFKVRRCSVRGGVQSNMFHCLLDEIRGTLVYDNSLMPTATWVLEIADVNMYKAKLVYFAFMDTSVLKCE